MADLWHVVEATSDKTEQAFFLALANALADVAEASAVLVLVSERHRYGVLALYSKNGVTPGSTGEVSFDESILADIATRAGSVRGPAPARLGSFGLDPSDTVVAASAPVGDTRHVIVCVVASAEGAGRISSRSLETFAVRAASELGAAERSAARGTDTRGRYELIAEAVGEVLWEADLERGTVEWHGPIGARFGYSNIRFTTLGWWDAKIHPDDRARVVAAFAVAVAGRETTWSVDYRFVRGDGTFARVRVRAMITRDNQGRATRAAGAMYDVSEQHALEQRFAIADRMASMGTLAAGLAHEINNPLTYVLGNLELGLTQLEAARASSETIDALREARQGATRVAEIIRSMRVFARTDPSVSSSADVDRVVDSAVRMAKNEIRHRARLTMRLGGPPLAAANETTLVQVVLNLVVNAAQAIPEGHVDHYQIVVTTGVTPDGRVFIEVRDSGLGMTAETMRRIFDPFFTTKAVGQGMGLGLSLVHSAVTACGGEITVDSALGQGSTFRVTLPEASASATMRRASLLVPVGGQRRILIVDDEAPVVRLLRRMLTADNDVVVVASGREAIETLREDRAFDAVLCDVMMPDITGADVHREVARESKGLAARFVFVTGGAFGERARTYVEATGQPIVYKPFVRSQIDRALDAAVIRGTAVEAALAESAPVSAVVGEAERPRVAVAGERSLLLHGLHGT